MLDGGCVQTRISATERQSSRKDCAGFVTRHLLTYFRQLQPKTLVSLEDTLPNKEFTKKFAIENRKAILPLRQRLKQWHFILTEASTELKTELGGAAKG